MIEQSCGSRLHDDFIETRPGAIEELEALLEAYGQNGQQDAALADAEPNSSNSGRWSKWATAAASWCQNIFPSGTKRLPQYRQGDASSAIPLGICTTPPRASGLDHHNFVLLCIPFMLWASKIHQPEVCRIQSDAEFFSLLRQSYLARRGRNSRTRLRKVQTLHFVKVGAVLTSKSRAVGG